MEYAAFVLIAFASSMVSAIFGLGTALLLLSIGVFLLPIKETIALATILFLAAGIVKTLLFRDKIDWRTTLWVTIGSLPFAWFGAELVDAAPAELLKKLLGAMVLVYLLVSITGWNLPLKPGKYGLLAGSCVYGFLSGLLGSGNIIKAILFREMSFGRQSFVGTMAATSVLTNTAKLTAYTKDGLIAPDHSYTILALIVSATISSLIGRLLLQKFSMVYFQYGLSILLACVALKLLI